MGSNGVRREKAAILVYNALKSNVKNNCCLIYNQLNFQLNLRRLPDSQIPFHDSSVVFCIDSTIYVTLTHSREMSYCRRLSILKLDI